MRSLPIALMNSSFVNNTEEQGPSLRGDGKGMFLQIVDKWGHDIFVPRIFCNKYKAGVPILPPSYCQGNWDLQWCKVRCVWKNVNNIPMFMTNNGMI